MLVLIFCCLFWAQIFAAPGKDFQRPNRIVGGVTVKPGDFPWQVSLQMVMDGRDGAVKMIHFCGGSLIEEEWVLTAAHCTQFVSFATVVKSGFWNLKEESAQFRILQVFQDGYNASLLTNDIALLKVEPIKRLPNDSSSAISLEEKTELQEEDCLISGWGSLQYDGQLPETLQAGKVSLKSDEECKRALGVSAEKIYPTNLCAGGESVDACQGDSGGPLVCCRDPSNPDISSCRLVGVTSWGFGCATPGVPGVYTEVAHYVKWIRQTIEENSSKDRKNKTQQDISKVNLYTNADKSKTIND